MKSYIFIFLCCASLCSFSQKDSLQLGDNYADDQIYTAIAYAQFHDQPSSISKSGFSYSFSLGFIKDITLNTSGTFSIAAGFGYGYDFFNHKLKVQEIQNQTSFSYDSSLSSNVFKSHTLELPFELRWRTSTAKKYKFWRVYPGIKFSYNLSNIFISENAESVITEYRNVSSYNKLQYGLTLSTGYDAFNIHIFYGIAPLFKNSFISSEEVTTKILKFGLIFYLL